MKTLKALDPAQAGEKTKPLFDEIEKRIHSLPNMIRVMGNSAPILKAYMQFNAAFNETRMPPKLRGLITAYVSELNGCDYTLSIAKALSQREDIAPEEFEAARQGKSDDPKTKSALWFAGKLVQKRGRVSALDLEDVFNNGFDDEQIVEIIGITALVVYRNYFNLATGAEIDFPLVKAGEPLVVPG